MLKAKIDELNKLVNGEPFDLDGVYLIMKDTAFVDLTKIDGVSVKSDYIDSFVGHIIKIKLGNISLSYQPSYHGNVDPVGIANVLRSIIEAVNENGKTQDY